MKIKKSVIALFLIVGLLAGLSVGATERKLTMDRAVQINDTQIILEFSEPIAINKFQTNNGPVIKIRLVNAQGGTTAITNNESKYYGKVMQWGGSIEYVDSKHDRLLFTFSDNAIGVDSIAGIRNYEGDLAAHSDYRIAMVLEELPYDTTKKYIDNAICNVTTQDGEVYLMPTYPAGYERCCVPLEMDYGYKVDLSATESTIEPLTVNKLDYSLIFAGEQEMTEESPVNRVLHNDPLIIAALLGGSGLLLVVMIAISVVLIRKKGRCE